MKIEWTKIPTDFRGERCYVHARGLILSDGFGLITTQKLELSGTDVFYGLEMMTTTDGGEHFSAPRICEHLKRRYFEDGTSIAMCDATPFYHKRTGKILLTGHAAMYSADNRIVKNPRPRQALYAVYDGERGDFDAWRAIEMPTDNKQTFFSAGAGCTQILELPTGELLIPIYYKSYETACDKNGCSSVAVLRCAFDGEEIKLLEIGTPMTVDVPRGLGEPSVALFGDEYLLALRNDERGYVAKSRDGLHFDLPRPICFDDGSALGNYNTQQHWLVGGGRLWLVYTRRAGNNDHVFRHRAPLFIAEFDTERMCVLRETEQIAVPERGARLGNFGCQSYSDEVGYVFASEWMQHGHDGWEYCAKYGSDNSIFVSKITY